MIYSVRNMFGSFRINAPGVHQSLSENAIPVDVRRCEQWTYARALWCHNFVSAQTTKFEKLASASQTCARQVIFHYTVANVHACVQQGIFEEIHTRSGI